MEPLAPRRFANATVVAVAILLALAPAPVLAHGDFDARVATLSAQINAEPSADRYLERSILYREHGDLVAALVDLQQAKRLDPTRRDLGLHRGRLALDAGRPDEAVAPLQGLLAKVPNHPEANLALARALAALGQSRGAATHYRRAIRAAPVGIPSHYLEWADALLASGKPQVALNGLDEGLGRLGPVVALANRAIEIELAQGRVDAALVRLDRLASRASRQETWLARRAGILEDSGRRAEARAAFVGALGEIERLPARRRATPAMAQLESRARDGVARLTRAPE
jgi:tetratricopeptide (TPR) repeat protein